ncbi:hypothetical protein PHJA_001005600 [Phtheirospermum japonicum]|uniref:Uncharacterized protein n=1 Tax=Phtheirospermum japonicum TaxID=374723 RepID=A0A830BRQ3_9LAMI|nr:hypothetical protein PHJA_001005600 [Phtheirospermum japonicum]
MDLGCIDMGCVEKPRKETSLEKDNNSPKESVTSASKSGKYNKAKDAVLSSLSALKSQISKPPRRKTSPVNWFPRKKVEPYLKRKIKMLQEVDGMQLTLDETLGDSNPHYSKVLREKMAIREAAEKAMEARKAAMVEASWCRILHAARIGSKEAEAQLAKAEHSAAEAFEAARVVGVIMNDEQNQYRIETSSATTHTVSATFETAFEVDKQVAGAVKAAFIKLTNCSSINKDKFKDLLRKISENPETDENHSNDATSSYFDSDIVDMMLSRIRCLKEDELASLATIVATSGLNAVLAETGNNENNNCQKVVGPRRMSVSGRSAKNVELPSLDKFLVKRLTRLEREVLEAKNARKNESFDDGNEKKLKEEGTAAIIPDLESGLVRNSSKLEKAQRAARTVGGLAIQDSAEVPSLDKFLVKRLTRFEREVLEAKNARIKESFDDGNEKKLKEEGAAAVFPDLESGAKDAGKNESLDDGSDVKLKEEETTATIPDSESGLVEHSLKLEKALEAGRAKQDSEEVPSLDKFLVKRLTRLEREVGEAKKGKKSGPDKENKNVNKIEAGQGSDYESLDKVLVKHVSKLEKEKLDFCGDEQMRIKPKRKDASRELESGEGSLDQVLVKRKSRLEREKAGAVVEQQNDEVDRPRHSVSRRQAREKELQAAWGGLSLGNSMRPHVSRLQRDKAEWIKAEEEERKRAVEEEV